MASNSWFPIPSDSHFSLANIPFGIITYPSHDIPRPAVAIGENALDLSIFSQAYGFASLPSIQPHSAVFRQTTLNDFAALGRPIHGQVRRYLQEIFDKDTKLPHILKDNPKLQKSCLQELRSVKTHLPLHIGDYTDFYAGRNHAQNCGELFRAVADALPPNYTHLPIGYHGRASSVVVSGTPIHRPRGQIKPTATDQSPTFAESQKLDMELELGAFIGRANAMGQPVPVEKAEENLFGFVLLNDLSARDIQMWEMAPLGPFNSKNFGTIISPWVVLADALEPFKTKGLENETRLLPYLQQKNRDKVYDINLEVTLTTGSNSSKVITRTNAKNLLFSFPQMIAHHTAGGCPLQVGDLLGSGTISGTGPGTAGSLLELTFNGRSKIQVGANAERAFLEDHDTITMTGWAGDTGGGLVGFGDSVGKIVPAFKSPE